MCNIYKVLFLIVCVLLRHTSHMLFARTSDTIGTCMSDVSHASRFLLTQSVISRTEVFSGAELGTAPFGQRPSITAPR